MSAVYMLCSFWLKISCYSLRKSVLVIVISVRISRTRRLVLSLGGWSSSREWMETLEITFWSFSIIWFFGSAFLNSPPSSVGAIFIHTRTSRFRFINYVQKVSNIYWLHMLLFGWRSIIMIMIMITLYVVLTFTVFS